MMIPTWLFAAMFLPPMFALTVLIGLIVWKILNET